MIQSEFSSAINQLAAERGISAESIVESIKQALLSAYRKEFETEAEDLEVSLDPISGEMRLMQDGKDVTPSGFGRIAAQTAKQVILQKINEAEKEAMLEEYRTKVGTIVSGSVFRTDRGNLMVELGKAHAVLPQAETISSEHLPFGKRVRFLFLEIREGERGGELILSRSHPDFVKGLFALEVPEIHAGTVIVEGISREAGVRTKIAVSASNPKIDPVGSCVGQKGVRVQAIMDELGEERIDIIPFDADISRYIMNSLLPAKVGLVTLHEDTRTATVDVAEDQLSLAIGRGGQNVRLASKLTGWDIVISGAEKEAEPVSEEEALREQEPADATDSPEEMGVEEVPSEENEAADGGEGSLSTESEGETS